MAFTGTTDKCKACDKTVYVMDLLTLEGMPFHKSCFRCTHCNGTLVMSNYSSMDGVLYCKTHFEQLFKESGNYSKNFHSATKSEKPNETTKVPNKLSSFFSGTQEKCATCKKTVYPLEKMTMEGENYHKTCFRCSHGGCPLTHSSYASLNGVLYCKVHFNQLFLEKGSYNHIQTTTAAANHHRHEEEEGDENVEKSTENVEDTAKDDDEDENSTKKDEDQEQETENSVAEVAESPADS